jgi:hypothetical protein
MLIIFSISLIKFKTLTWPRMVSLGWWGRGGDLRMYRRNIPFFYIVYIYLESLLLTMFFYKLSEI